MRQLFGCYDAEQRWGALLQLCVCRGGGPVCVAVVTYAPHCSLRGSDQWVSLLCGVCPALSTYANQQAPTSKHRVTHQRSQPCPCWDACCLLWDIASTNSVSGRMCRGIMCRSRCSRLLRSALAAL